MLMFAQRCTLTNSVPLFAPRGSPGHTRCLFVQHELSQPPFMLVPILSLNSPDPPLALRHLAENRDPTTAATAATTAALAATTTTTNHRDHHNLA